MKIIDSGHIYELASFDGTKSNILTFVKRIGDNFPGNKFAFPGTISQEVLRALLERQKYVNAQMAFPENIIVIQNLRQALWQLEARAKRVRNEYMQRTVNEIEMFIPCEYCGHIDCTLTEHKIK